MIQTVTRVKHPLDMNTKYAFKFSETRVRPIGNVRPILCVRKAQMLKIQRIRTKIATERNIWRCAHARGHFRALFPSHVGAPFDALNVCVCCSLAFAIILSNRS